MDHEFELSMKDLAVETMKKSYRKFMSGDIHGYRIYLDEALYAIHGIERLGFSPDNPKFLWAGRLNCDWNLVNALEILKHPGILTRIYRECYFAPYPQSLVIDGSMPYLPSSCTDIFDFYHIPVSKADSFADDLTEAIRLYSKITSGCGSGTDLMFRSGLAMRRGNSREAYLLASQALETGGRWLQPYAQRIMEQTG